MNNLLLGILAAALLQPAQGIHLKLSGTRNEHLSKRGNIAGTSSLSDSGDVSYYANISLGGSSFSVLVDTGSSDLWVAGSVPSTKSTGKSAGVTYAIGQVTGPVKTTALEFAGYTVANQAFIEVTADSTHPANIGLIGLGPNTGSSVFNALGDASGEAVLDRIFKQNTTTPNYLTVLMGRYDDPTDTFPGDLTVGTVVPGYEDISNQAKLDVTDVSIFNKGDQHWQSLLDADGILGPDGKAISLSTVVASTSNGKQLTVVFDTGFSLPQVPKYVSDSVYGRIPGAVFTQRSDVGGIWQLPCDREVNMTFVFAGNKIPIHPLDTNLDLNVTDANGDKVCLGAFQPISTTTGGTYDAILGMAFIRNAYMLINYGDFLDGASTTADPFIQLLALTNSSSEAHSDFVKVRMNGKDTTNWSLLPPSSNGSAPETQNTFVRKIKYYAPIIGGVVGALILGLLIWLVCSRRRKAKNVRYQPLSDPAPQGAVDLHLMQNQQQQGNRQSRGPPPEYSEESAPRASTSDYRNPWDPRY